VLEAGFPKRSVPRLCNEEQLRLRESLETAVTEVGVCCETVACSKDVNTEAEEAMALEDFTRR
jgi:hypothetical protein